MPLTFTFEFPLVVRTTSATAPIYQLGNITARNALQRARLTTEIQDIPKDLHEAAEHLIRGEPVPPSVQTKLFNLSPRM